MEPTFQDKVEDVIDSLENPGSMTAFIFAAHDSEGNYQRTTAQRPGIGKVDWTLLLAVVILRISRILEMHPEDAVQLGLERARDIDESDAVSY